MTEQAHGGTTARAGSREATYGWLALSLGFLVLALYLWVWVITPSAPWWPVVAALLGAFAAVIAYATSRPRAAATHSVGARARSALAALLTVGALVIVGVTAANAAPLAGASADSPARVGDTADVVVEDFEGTSVVSMSLISLTELRVREASAVRQCWKATFAVGVDRSSPLRDFPRDVTDGHQWVEVYLDSQDGSSSAMATDEPGVSDCVLDYRGTLDVSDPTRASQLGLFDATVVWDGDELPAYVTLKDDAGRQVVYALDEDGCLSRETESYDLGFSPRGDDTMGCPYVVDLGDQKAIEIEYQREVVE